MNCCGRRKFAENVYYHELARELRVSAIRFATRHAAIFKSKAFPKKFANVFPNGMRQIDKALAKLLAEKPELAGANIKDLRERLATDERTRKQKDLSRAELRTAVGLRS